MKEAHRSAGEVTWGFEYPHPWQVFAADVSVEIPPASRPATRRQHHGQLRPLPRHVGNRDTQANCPTIAMNAGEFGARTNRTTMSSSSNTSIAKKARTKA